MTEKEKIMQISVNPLAFSEVDMSFLPNSKKANIEDVIRFLCKPEIPCDIDSLIERYKKINGNSKTIVATPIEEHFRERIVQPMRSAKGCFTVGNYIGTIALCGMVSEMITLLRFEMSNIMINGRPLNEKDEKKLFGRQFERLNQERRLEILSAYNLISDEINGKLHIIKGIRNKYLHIFEQDYSEMEQDAIKIYTETIEIIIGITGLTVSDGRIRLHNDLISYLEKKGILEPSA